MYANIYFSSFNANLMVVSSIFCQFNSLLQYLFTHLLWLDLIGPVYLR